MRDWRRLRDVVGPIDGKMKLARLADKMRRAFAAPPRSQSLLFAPCFRSKKPKNPTGRNALPFLLCLLILACGKSSDGHDEYSYPYGVSTFEKYLPQAQAGEVKYQNLLGYMSFFGEGAPMDFDQAHLWFHLAAQAGYEPARHNLDVIHELGVAHPVDFSAAEQKAHESSAPSQQILNHLGAARRSQHRATPGQSTYVTFCAGCHGLNGIAAFIGSPSFALGERMHKSDADLLDSIRNGRGAMPAWGGKLPDSDLRTVLGFVRGLEQKYIAGIDQALLGAPDLYFLFGPMTDNDSAYRGSP